VKLGAYEVEDEIGRGGMGVVLRGRSPDGRVVALKILNTLAPREALDRFARERRLLSAFSEAEGFVPLLDAGDSPKGPFVAMPFVPGGTLRAKLERGPLPVAGALALGVELARAIGRAHARGVVHRDLKPENILFTGEGRPLISDLGLAKHFRRDTEGSSQSLSLTAADGMKGTIGYAAPEQMTNAREVGPAADVFALGVILYECLAGQTPFHGASGLELVANVEAGDFAPLKKVRADVPPGLASVVERALAHDPKERFADGDELARALAASEGAQVPTSGGVPPIVFALGLGAAAAFGALGVWLERPRPIELVIERPAPDEPAPGDTVSVAGRAVGASLVLVDGAPTPVGNDGRFEAHTPLASPESEVVVQASGPGALSSEARVRVRSQLPAWFLSLRGSERPKWPLPPGLEASSRPGEYVNAVDGSVLVYVPPGDFVQGTGEPNLPTPSGPPHLVRLSGYFLGKLEVTNAQFAEFVRKTNHRTRAEELGSATALAADGTHWVVQKGITWRDPFGQGTPPPNHPVVLVSWRDAVAYCQWAHLRLPSESQWERAAAWDARAGRARRYAWGNDPPGRGSAPVANVCDDSFLRVYPLRAPNSFAGYEDGYARLAPVGSFPLGASPVGALDMTGNVFELCADGWDPDFYSKSPFVDPQASSEGATAHCGRGGGWADFPPYSLAANRLPVDQDRVGVYIGFRVAR
jgi:formylglycine-generating enzyme required for sulfatase activity